MHKLFLTLILFIGVALVVPAQNVVTNQQKTTQTEDDDDFSDLREGFVEDGDDEDDVDEEDDGEEVVAEDDVTPSATPATTTVQYVNAQQNIDMPEAMMTSVDSLLGDWMARQYLASDSVSINAAVNITYEQAVYVDRLRRIPAVMELSYNEKVQALIDQYSGRLKGSVSYMLGAGNFYMPLFEEALDFYGVPLELKYLPIIESALNPRAQSRVGAVGLWQFMLTTGKKYGLEVNSLIDERRDPVKSSFAAAHYLKDLYNSYGDWNLVIAAYNCGPGNVNKAIARSGGEKDYWRIYPYLPHETRNYVPAFIAATYIMNYYCEHGIEPMEATLPAATDTIVVNRDVNMRQISAVCGVEMDALQALNPQYRTDMVPGYSKKCYIRLPQDKVKTFLEQEDSVYAYRASELLTRRAIAIPVQATSSDYSRVTTSSSSRSTYSSKSKKSKSKKSSGGSKTVTIRQGDTLGAIAARNHTTVAKLRQLNGIKGDNIRAGKTLKVK